MQERIGLHRNAKSASMLRPHSSTFKYIFDESNTHDAVGALNNKFQHNSRNTDFKRDRG